MPPRRDRATDDLPLFAGLAAGGGPSAPPSPLVPRPSSPDRVYRVGEIARQIRSVVEDGFPDPVTVEGEVSNLRRQPSGHIYFTLKDADAQLNAVWFRGGQTAFAHRIADGAQVRVTGEIRTYELRSQYQILVRSACEAGRGALFEALEKLKAKLAAEGLFDPARKRPLPRLPRCIGVATSTSGAALRDILKVLRRRFPTMRVLIAPCRVQGAGAAAEVAAAIDRLGAVPGVDVILAGRGGGSIEDLWAFNEEPVVRAIARSPVPVISAVGHETDFTLADFVADHRAPTPSAAAEMAVAPRAEFDQTLAEAGDRLRRAVAHALTERRGRVRTAAMHPVLRDPVEVVARARERVRGRSGAVAAALRDGLARARQRLDDAQSRVRERLLGAGARARSRLAATDANRLRRAAGRSTADARQRTARGAAQLRALSPIAVLDRGYSITWSADGTVLRSAAQTAPGLLITTQVRDGKFESEVKRTDGGG
ncbi:MAG: exodeoxyribonuclease VII large subunit [Verrucomicrobia bacterium]|nr:exodeoxyribonuclease VII large subunit [Verrucomicrobiota bacterium]